MYQIKLVPRSKHFKPHIWKEGGDFFTKEGAEFQARQIRKMKDLYKEVIVLPKKEVIMKTYIEIVRFEGNQVTHRIDVTGRGERGIERTEDGVNINLNHDKFYTKITESKVELPLFWVELQDEPETGK